MNRSFEDTRFSFGPEIPRDPWTLGAITQSMETAMIHQGKAFRLDGTFAANGTNKPVISMVPPALSAAAVTVDMTKANADMTYTAATKGEAGNAIRVIHTAPDVASSPLSIRVDGLQITVSLATNGAKAVTTTALALATALNADSAASALIVATYEGTGLGVVNADAGTANALTGGTENVYCFFKVGTLTAAADTVTVNFYEDATFTGTAATFTPINRNRVIRTASRIPFSGTLAGTVTTTSATKIGGCAVRGSATGANTHQAQRADDNEFLLCPGKRYIIEFVPAGATAIDYCFFGYELSGFTWQS